jgi:hypothetical protein
VTVSPEIQHILLLTRPVAVAISIVAVLISMRSARNTPFAVVLLTLAGLHAVVTWVLVPTPFGDSACRLPMRPLRHAFEFIAQCGGPVWWVAPVVLSTAVLIWLAWRDVR